VDQLVTSSAIEDTLLVSYLDGELDSTTARLVEDQFDNDQAVRERLALLQTTDELLRAALATPEQPAISPDLQAKVDRLFRPPRPLIGRRFAMPLAVAAALGGFVIAGPYIVGHLPFGNGSTNSTVAHVLNEVVEYHAVFGYETEHLVEVPASRQTELERWLSARVKFAFNAPDLSSHDLEFRGGRLLAIDSQPVAQLMYTGKDGANVALCIALTSGDATSQLQQRQDDDLTSLGKGVGHHVFVVVGPSSNSNLKAIAESMPESLHRT
jgi:anti-sigma factor RsiW